MNKRILLFIEKVVTSETMGYSIPNVIEDTKDIQALIDIIENDKDLFKMVYAVDSGYSDAKAADIWKRIAATPEGAALAKKYGSGYRISSSRRRGAGMEENAYPQQDPTKPETTRPIDVYDKKANSASTEIESFYKFFTSGESRPNEVSGGSPGSSPPK